MRGFRSNRDFFAAGLVNFCVEWVSHPEDRFLTHPWHRWYLVLLIFGEANASATSSECHRHFRRFLLLMFLTLQDDVKGDIEPNHLNDVVVVPWQPEDLNQPYERSDIFYMSTAGSLNQNVTQKNGCYIACVQIHGVQINYCTQF